MKVKNIIKQLSEYNPEDNLIIAYWDKDFADNITPVFNQEIQPLTNEQWDEVVKRVEDCEEPSTQTIVDIIGEVIEK